MCATQSAIVCLGSLGPIVVFIYKGGTGLTDTEEFGVRERNKLVLIRLYERQEG